MRLFLKLTTTALYCALASVPSAWSDQITMTSGERFITDRIWADGDKVRFSMQGLVVSVHKDEVASVVGADGKPLPLAAPAMPPAPTSKPTPTPAPMPTPILTPAPAVTAAAPAPIRAPRLPWSTDEGRQPSPSPVPSPLRRVMVPGTGLGQATWGMAPGELPGLKKLKTDPIYGGVDQYWRPDQRLQFGEALLDGWVYSFWQDQLYSIIMWAQGRIGYERMKNEIFAHYGKGIQRRPEVERFIWDDGPSQRMLEFDGRSQSAIFVMRSSEVDQQIKARYPAVPVTTASPTTASN